MLTAEARSRLTVVLVGARNPQNIGAAARALQDFGFRDLRVVNEFTPPFEAAQLEANQLEVHQLEAKSAVGAGEVMRSARLFRSLPEAIADCTLVTGTTAIGGRGLRLPIHSLQDAAPRLLHQLRTTTHIEPTHLKTSQLKASQLERTDQKTSPLETSSLADGIPATPPTTRVALLFGSEKTGLTNEQLSHCSLLLTIPLFSPAGRHLSMNLGQSVAVCLYELTREGLEGARALPVQANIGATSADRERLTSLLLRLMTSSGYARRFPANARVEVVRQLVGSLGETREDAATWMGILKHVQRPEEPDPAEQA